MIGAFVVDASITAAWLLPDEASELSEALLSATARMNVWVPALWQLETCNLLLSARRRKRIDDAKRRELIAAAAGLRLMIDPGPPSMVELDRLASAHSLSAHDAVYLELALRRQLPLASLDAGLRRAIERVGASGVGLDDL